MRPSLRFLALAIVGWAGIRAATLGALPGVSIFPAAPSETKPAPAPVAQTQFPPIEPLQPAVQPQPLQPQMFPAGWPMMYGRPLAVPVYYSYPPPQRPVMVTSIAPEPRPAFFPPVPQLDEWPLSRMASNAIPARSSVVTPMQTTSPAIVQARLDRIQLVMWAMLRGQQGQILGPTSLASGGQLGGSQAGGRLFYNFTPDIAAVLRSSSDVGRRGGEVAAGIRVRPIRSIPVWFTAERRQRLLKYGGGRNAFAFFAEGGVYDRPMPWGFTLDGYAQGGVVGLKSRDLFADGGVTFTHPLYRQFLAGFGVWGGVQPGLYRVDVGPRLTMRVRNNIKVHLDWRQRVAGNAEPGSGPAVTLSGNF